MNSVTPIVVGIILVLVMIVAGFGVFQSTISEAGNSLFKEDDSLLGNAENSGETENSELNSKNKLDLGDTVLRAL